MTDIIVLGLGAMGSSACYHLAKLGLNVIGIEQFEVGHERGSSHGKSRIIRKAYFEHPDYVPLLNRSYELWEMLSHETDQTLYHETGLIYFCPEQGKMYQGITSAAKIHKIPLELLSGNHLKKYQNRFQVPQDFKILFEPQAGFLEVENCVKAHIKSAQKFKAKILQNEVVLSWKATESHVEVHTNKGLYQASRLVIAGGAWSERLLNDLGLSLQVLQKTMFWFKAADSFLEKNQTPCFLYELPEGIFYGFPSLEGHALKVAEHSGGLKVTHPLKLDQNLNQNEFLKVKNFVQQYFIGCGPELLSYKTCFYTMTPDENFILDLHPKYKNVSFAAGFSGHGFKFSSVIGEILSHFATTGSTKLPIDFLRLR